MKQQKHIFNSKAEKEINNIEESGIKDINKLFKLRDFLFPSELKYQIFSNMIKFNNETVFEEVSLDDYNEVKKLRNKLAHKKLEVCGAQQHIICSDNINQHKDRLCSPDCDSASTDDNKISLDQWDIMRKKSLSMVSTLMIY